MRIGLITYLCRPIVGVVFALSVVASLYGLGSTLTRTLTPAESRGRFHGIAADGWVTSGAVISIPGVLGRGNRLELLFDAWRPGGAPPAEQEVVACGEVVARTIITPDQRRLNISLRGACDPLSVSFVVKNPIVASARDNRLIGARLISAKVYSLLGVAIPNLSALVSTSAAIFFLALLVLALVETAVSQPRAALAASALVPLAAGLVLSTTESLALGKVVTLWMFFTGIAGGAVLALFRPSNSEPCKPASEHLDFRITWRVALVVIVLVGGLLRFYGLTFGLPSNYHPDEVPKINAIMHMVANHDLNPDYFLHPSLLLYLTYGMNALLHWASFPFSSLEIPSDFRTTAFLAGRIVSALAGTTSIYLVYCIGRRLFTPHVGIAAAALLAVFPLHVTCSRYMKEDVLLTFNLLLCIAILLKAVQEDRKGLLFLSAFFAGVTASSKYSGLLAVGIVGLAPWLRSRSVIPDREYICWTALALVLAPVGFLVCTPYAVLNTQIFLRDFGSERNHMLRGHTIPVDPWSQYWMYHFWRSIIPGMSLAATILGVLGMGFLLWRRRAEDLFVVTLILLFYLPAEWVKAKPEPQPERYIFPCLPFLAIAAAELVRAYSASRARVLAGVAFVVALIMPLSRTIALAADVPDDTRTRAARWMVENLPRGARVYLDWKPYAPRFWHNEFSVMYIPRTRILERLAYDDLKRSGYDYLVLSGLFYERYFTQPDADPALGERIRQVFLKVPILKEFAAKSGTYGFNNPRVTIFSLKPEDFANLEAQRERKNSGSITETLNDERSGFPWVGAR